MPDFTHHLLFYSAETEGASPISGKSFRIVDAQNALPALPEHLLRFADAHKGRFIEGHSAVIGETESRIVFIAWLAFGSLRIDELAREWKLAPDEAVVYDVFTMPEARGKGWYPDALTWLRVELKKSGIARCWIYAERGNSASIKGIEKAGFACRGALRSLLIGKFAACAGRVDGARI